MPYCVSMFHDAFKRVRSGLLVITIAVLSFLAVVIAFSVAESLWRSR